MAAFAGLAVAWLLLFLPSLPELHRRWTIGFSYTHGYLVLGMAVWLGRHVLQRAGAVQFKPLWSANALLALGCLAVVAVQAVGIDIAQQMALPGITWLVILSVFGVSLALRLAPAFAFLFFAVPVWDVLVTPLQTLTTNVVGLMLKLNDFPVLISGYSVRVPAGDFEVAGGCSGLHFIVVGLTIAVFYGMTEMRSLRGRLLALGVALGLAFLTNWVRVYTLIVVGQMSDMQHYLITTDHYFFGWVLFGIAMFVFFVVVRRLEPAPPNDRRPLTTSSDPVLGGAALTTGVVMVVPALLLALVQSGAPDGDYVVNPQLPSDWQVTREPQASWRPIQSSNAVVAEGYAESETATLDWYIAWYPSQENNLELMAWGNRPHAESHQVAWVEDGDLYRLAEIRSPYGVRRLIAWRQSVAGQRVRSRVEAKLGQLRGMLTGDYSALFVAVSRTCVESCLEEQDRFDAAATAYFELLRVDIGEEGDDDES
ncbi:MAG: exosortase [Pseudomonadota bacterium]